MKFSPDGPRDQQAAVVGAEVDRGIGIAAGAERRRRRVLRARRGARPSLGRCGVAGPAAEPASAEARDGHARGSVVRAPVALVRRSLRHAAGGGQIRHDQHTLYHYPAGRGGYLAAMLDPSGASGKGSAVLDAGRPARLEARRLIAPSSNGKTTDSDSVYRGSNPRGASSFIYPSKRRDDPATNRWSFLRSADLSFPRALSAILARWDQRSPERTGSP